MSTSFSVLSLSPGISNFRRVKEDIEALKEEVKVVKESAHSASKDLSPWRVRVQNHYGRSRNLDDLIQWEWAGNDPVTEEQWRSFWDSFLRVSSRVFEAFPGKRLPIEELIPVPLAHEFSSLVHACADQWETFKEKYAAQVVLSNNWTRTLPITVLCVQQCRFRSDQRLWDGGEHFNNPTIRCLRVST